MKIKNRTTGSQARIRRTLEKPPRAGTGVHRWLFTTALKHHRLGVQPEQICSLLADAVKGCGRDVPSSEIRDAVVNSGRPNRGAGRGSAGVLIRAESRSKWPLVNDAALSHILSRSKTNLQNLITSSPMDTSAEADSKSYLKLLFEGDELICIGRSMERFGTWSLGQLLISDLTEATLIVPSPMTQKWGVTKDGKRSQHTLSNTGPRRYLVTEFDSGAADSQAAIITHLRAFAPLVMVLSSGGKSLHAWWQCGDNSETQQLAFFRYAVSLGADPATWTRSQFVRLPMGWREDRGRRQQVYFFNPAVATTRNGGVK